MLAEGSERVMYGWGGVNVLALTPQNRTNLHHPLECVAMRMINDAAGVMRGTETEEEAVTLRLTTSPGVSLSPLIPNDSAH